jgi:hypothetical protein
MDRKQMWWQAYCAALGGIAASNQMGIVDSASWAANHANKALEAFDFHWPTAPDVECNCAEADPRGRIAR